MAMPSARALVNRARILGLGLTASVAIAVSGCDYPISERLKECRYVSRPLTSTTGATFRYLEDTVYVDGPNMCRTVTDTEGWDRTFCHKGPDAAICRKVAR